MNPYESIVRALCTAIVVDGRVLDADTGKNLIHMAKALCEVTTAPERTADTK